MLFIGIISDTKEFEIIKSYILKNIKENKPNIININKQSIKNIKNIKFDFILIDNNLSKMTEEEENINKICKDTKYIILNSDINLKVNILEEHKANIITYGLNQKATVTVSSITQENVLVDIQRNIKDLKGNIIGVGERRVKINEQSKIKIYNLLAIYIIFLIYDEKIIDIIQEKTNFFI